MHRRDVLRLLATGAGIGCLEGLPLDEILALGRHLHARAGDGAQGLRVLGLHERRTVTAAAERIILRSDTPGATDAGVTGFIDRIMADWYAPAERDRLLEGLAELDRRSRARSGDDFAGQNEADQVALLTAIDGEVDALRRALATHNAGDHWFAMLKFLTVWGYFTSEVAVRHTLRAFPLPWRYDACAPYQPPAGRP